MKTLLLLAAIAALSLANPLSAQTQDLPEYLPYFDPAAGFKPAQTNLTNIFLQIAGSLEYYGSPVPYLRHMKAEHERIEAEYRGKFGCDPADRCPAYMTTDYLDTLEKNWNILSPKLGLEALAKEDGAMMIGIIKGAKGTGTTVIGIFNEHQKAVLDAMAGKASPVGFDALQTQLLTRLELNEEGRAAHAAEIAHTVAMETALSASGKAAYASFLQRDYVTREDFPALEAFYKSNFDRLTEHGKTEMTVRILNGTRGDGARSSAIETAARMQERTHKLFAQLEAAMPPNDANALEKAITSVYLDVGRMAQSELEAGLAEWAFDQPPIAAAK